LIGIDVYVINKIDFEYQDELEEAFLKNDRSIYLN